MQNRAAEKEVINIFNEVLSTRASSEIIKTLNDMPILTVKTTLKNSGTNENIPCIVNNSFISIKTQPDTHCIFELNIFREGSSKMNVYSKKFNKQKEEFWFLIFVERDFMTFRKFSFSRRTKRIDLPVQMPFQKDHSAIPKTYELPLNNMKFTHSVKLVSEHRNSETFAGNAGMQTA
ncbi:hypothetical protein NQ318_017267 [Aromia moschata]|uniref:Uncharacterized protein n=1 Tax=Aromia moschata TaxID=1265417 RepID=A0AAV8X7X6_9CUCU|nr:hypothetical protein NQ318_017267 [Aromia moschata]